MKFYIEVDNASLSYSGGQVVTGTVHVDLDVDEKSTGLTLRCVGNAEAHSADKHNLNQEIHDLTNHRHRGVDHQVIQNTITKHHTAREKYFEYNIILFGHNDASESIIPAGPQAFPFKFELPVRLPSSFQGSNGTVQYYLHAKIKRPHLFEYEARTVFQINGQLDLNVYPGAAEPTEIRKERNACCLCCKTGPLGFSFRLTRTGFVCGEMLKFTANLYNMSSTGVPKTCIRLDQTASFHAGGTTKNETITIMEIGGPYLEAGETKIWEENRIQVPDVPPTKLGGCEIVGVEYFVKMVMSVPNGIDLVGSIPVVIGTTPFQAHLFEEIVSVLSSAGASASASKTNSVASGPNGTSDEG